MARAPSILQRRMAHEQYVGLTTDASVERERERRIHLLFQREKDFLEVGKCFCELKLDTFPPIPERDHEMTSAEEILLNVIDGLKHIKTVLGLTARKTIFKNVMDLATKLTGRSPANIHRKVRAFGSSRKRGALRKKGDKKTKRKKLSKTDDEESMSDEDEEFEQDEIDDDIDNEKEEELKLTVECDNSKKVVGSTSNFLTDDDMKSYIEGKQKEEINTHIFKARKAGIPMVEPLQPSSSAESPFVLMAQPSYHNEPGSALRDAPKIDYASTSRADDTLSMTIHHVARRKETITLPVKRESIQSRTATTDTARLTISQAILMYPRVIFTWAEFLNHTGPAITTYSERLIKIVLVSLLKDGLLYNVCGSSVITLNSNTVFMKETRSTLLDRLALYKFKPDVYMLRIFGKPNMDVLNWLPLIDQIAEFDSDPLKPLTSSNPKHQVMPELIQHTLCLAILQTQELTVRPVDVKIKNLLMLDNAFNRLQREHLISPANTSSRDPIEWEFDKVLFVAQTNDRLNYYYGIDSTFLSCLDSFQLQPSEDQAIEQADDGNSPMVSINTLEDILMATEAASSLNGTFDPGNDIIEVKKEVLE